MKVCSISLAHKWSTTQRDPALQCRELCYCLDVHTRRSGHVPPTKHVGATPVDGERASFMVAGTMCPSRVCMSLVVLILAAVNFDFATTITGFLVPLMEPCKFWVAYVLDDGHVEIFDPGSYILKISNCSNRGNHGAEVQSCRTNVNNMFI